MLTKPIVLQREWIKFWHLLGFHVDPEIPKYSEDSPKTKTKNKPAVPSPASGLESTKEKTEETDDDLTVKKVKALVCIAALSTAAMAKCYAADLRLKCANLVLELAKWLAAVWHSPPSNEGSPKEACSIGWEVEEPSRAIGQKKVQKARGHEPAATNLPRENEPGRSTLKNETLKYVEAPRENEPGDNNLGEFWEPSNEVCWDHREYHTPQEFWDCTSEDEFGDCVAWHSCGQAQHVLESVGCDSPLENMTSVHGHCWPLSTTAQRAAPVVVRSNSQPWRRRCQSRSHLCRRRCLNLLRSLRRLLLLRRCLRLLAQNEKLHR
jgi:hypothetical protein